VGDAYFPFAGNGGYDVQHYDLRLTYTPPPPAPAPLVGHLDAVATIDLVATRDPRQVQPRPPRSGGRIRHRRRQTARAGRSAGAAVDGPAWWHVQDAAERVWELTLQPRPKLKAGTTARVVIAYGGDTARPRDLGGELYGWVTTRDGAMVVSEPDGSMTW
jgi:hypothetical protein